MDATTNSISLSQGSFWLAALFLVLAIVWLTVNQFRFVRNRLARYTWGVAFANLFIIPFAVLSAGLLIQGVLGSFGLAQWQDATVTITQLAICVAVTTGLGRFVELRLERASSSGQITKLSQLARTALNVLFVLLGVLAFLLINDYSPTKLYVSTGAVTAILAFAMQQTLGDLFSGIALSVEKPFRIGDWLRFDDGTEGEVIDINWRSTHLRSWSEGTYVIPNSQLSRQRFLNLHGSKHPYAQLFDIRVSGEHDPREVAALLVSTLKKCDGILQKPAPSARLRDGSKNPYTYYVWVYFKNYPSMFAGREEIYQKLHVVLHENGLEVAADMYDVRHRPLGP